MSVKPDVDLLQLQHLVKSDPQSYRDEFEQQKIRYEAERQIFMLKPTEKPRSFVNLVNFLSHVIPCYPKAMPNFGEELMELLENDMNNVDNELRRALVPNLIMLCNRSIISKSRIYSLFVKLLGIPDKLVRKQLYSFLLNDTVRQNQKKRSDQSNRSFQNQLFGTIKDDSNRSASRIALKVVIELFRRNIWHDSRTVGIVAAACLSLDAHLMSTALKFFIGEDEDLEQRGSDSESSEDEVAETTKALPSRHSKSGRKKLRLIEAGGGKAKMRKKKIASNQPNFSAMQLLDDPQGFAEKLFSHLRQSKAQFAVRIMLMNFLSRLIGYHSLIVLNFYPYIQRYIQPHQRHITLLLSLVAQSCHDLVPPDTIEPIISTIATNFVTERSRPEAISIGLNTIRIICSRVPLAMNATLLQDLVEYKSFKDKGVMMAARSLLQLYRSVDKSLLKTKDRGKPGSVEVSRPIQFGAQIVVDPLAPPGDESEEEEEEEEGEEEDMEEGEEENSEMESEISDVDQPEDEEVKEKKEQAGKRKLEKIMKGSKELGGERVREDDILGFTKKRKLNKAERLKSVMEGREGRETYGSAHKVKVGGFSNVQKEKKKMFALVKHGSRMKSKLRPKERRFGSKSKNKQFGIHKRK